MDLDDLEDTYPVKDGRTAAPPASWRRSAPPPIITQRTADPEFFMVPLVHVAVACGIVSEVTIQFKLNVTCLHAPSNNIKLTFEG